MDRSRLELLAEDWRPLVEDAVDWLVARGFGGARTGLILGSGLGGFADGLDEARAVDYGEIPGFAAASVAEHAGRLVRGAVGGTPVVVMQGRLHPYEGLPAARTLLPTAVLACLGVADVLVTNAAGGLNRHYRPGDLMVIRDQLDLHPGDPLRGLLAAPFPTPAARAVGRVPGLVGLYGADLAARLMAAAAAAGVAVHAGTYVSMSGPAYETRAEIGMLRRAGGDAVGMSTAPEGALLARLGVGVAGLSCITNPARETGQPVLSHQDVVEAGRLVRHRMERLLGAYLGASSGG